MKTPLQSERRGFGCSRAKSQPASCVMRVLLTGGVLLVFSLINVAGHAEGANFCRQTSQKALHSCQQGARSDSWLALGRCANLPEEASRSVRKECQREASADRKDATETCDDQHDARQAVCERLGAAPYDPVIDPADFVANIDNPYFPLTPGTTFIYEGLTDSDLEHNEVFVTHNTKVILGVTCLEVRDTVHLNGELIEDTLDWFAQDKDGNVWYFGENAKQIAGGLVVGLEGSWTAGVDGAKPGIIMKAQPAAGDFYRQEFSLEDRKSVV